MLIINLRAEDVMVDLSATTGIDEALAGALVAMTSVCDEAGRPLRICNVPPSGDTYPSGGSVLSTAGRITLCP